MNVIDADRSGLTYRQRWASYLALAVAAVGLLAGYLLSQNVINATVPFSNPTFGIAARYPARWLLSDLSNAQANSSFNVVLRVEDAQAIPFKTSLQVALIPIGPDANATEILNALNISRGDKFSTFQRLSTDPTRLADGSPATQMTYAYAFVGSDQFQQSAPIMVRAVDVVVLRGSQAIVITYEADDRSFDHNQHFFDSFLRTLNLKTG